MTEAFAAVAGFFFACILVLARALIRVRERIVRLETKINGGK